LFDEDSDLADNTHVYENLDTKNKKDNNENNVDNENKDLSDIQAKIEIAGEDFGENNTVKNTDNNVLENGDKDNNGDNNETEVKSDIKDNLTKDPLEDSGDFLGDTTKTSNNNGNKQQAVLDFSDLSDEDNLTSKKDEEPKIEVKNETTDNTGEYNLFGDKKEFGIFDQNPNQKTPPQTQNVFEDEDSDDIFN